MSTFLNYDDVAALTGRKSKSKQIEALRKMGLPFWVNAIGKPVVSTSVVEGTRREISHKRAWTPPA